MRWTTDRSVGRAWEGVRWVMSFWAGAALSVAWAAPAAGQCVTPTTDTGFAEIIVDVEAGTFDRVLPFDVPIRLCGQVPADTTAVTVQYAEARGALEVEPDTCRILSPAGVEWLPSEPIPARLDDSDNTFRAVLPRLEAQRYYVFCFRRQQAVSDATIMAFEPEAREALDAGLRQVTSGDVTEVESARICSDLHDRLLEVANADEVITGGTLFDPRACAGRLRGRFDAQLRAVLEPQLRRQTILQGRSAPGQPAVASYANLQFDLSRSLKAVAGDGALDRLAAELEQQAASDANLETLLKNQFPHALALVDLSDEEASRLAQGLAPQGADGAPTLDEIWDPSQVAPVVESYDATNQALEDLAELVNKMVGSPGIPEVKAALSGAETAALQALIASDGPVREASDGAFRLEGLAMNIREALQARTAALGALAMEVSLAAQDVQVADGSTTGNFETFKNFYISADAGVVYAPEIDEVVTYVGTNIYLRPVNKNASLSQLGSFRETFTRRFALTLGLTVQSIADGGDSAVQTRDDLFGSQALLVGAGLRLTDMIRLGAGALVFKEQDPNPLVDDLSVSTTYYLTISFDLNVARAFQGVGGLFGGGGG